MSDSSVWCMDVEEEGVYRVGNVLSPHTQRLPRSPQLSHAVSRPEHRARGWLSSGRVHKPL